MNTGKMMARIIPACFLSVVSHRSAALGFRATAAPLLLRQTFSSPTLYTRSLTAWSTKEGSTKITRAGDKEDIIKNPPLASDAISQSSSSQRSEDTIRRRSNKFWRRPVSQALSVVGFVHSSTRALLVKGRPSQWRRTVRELLAYLQETGLDQEWKTALVNYRLLDNIRILNRIEDLRGDRRERAARDAGIAMKIPDTKEALRYMKFATAVYGDAMIRAAEMDVKGKIDARILPVTRTRISDHCSIAEEDIVVLDVDFKGDSKHLRHLVALDRENEKIVLAIRGTFSVSEVAVDIAGFTRPFCSGEAHSEMANMAERIWLETGPRVLELLEEYPNFELVLCGHSLGAGVACLLQILLDEQGILPNTFCFAFAAPPTYTKLNSAARCINYISQRDVVPFLSVHAIRKYVRRIKAIDDQKLSWSDRFALIRNGTGIELLQEDTNDDKWDEKPGAPLLLIPAAANVWIQEDKDGLYTARICDSRALADLGIMLDLSMLQDHVPSQYEQTLSHYWEDGRRGSAPVVL